MERFWDLVSRGSQLALLLLTLSWVGYIAVEVSGALQRNRENNRQYQADAKQRQELASKDISQRCAQGIDSIEEIRSCLAKEIESYREQNKSSRELDIQQQAADWAFFSLLVSFAALFVSAGGLLMLKASLKHTREAINISREIGHAQVRAYVSALPQGFEPREGNRPMVQLIMKNSGQSPALEFYHIADVRLMEHPVVDHSKLMIAAFDGQTPPSGVLPPGLMHSADVIADDSISREEIEEILRNGDRRLYFIARVFYKDVFDVRRETIVCAYSSVSPIRGRADAFRVDWVFTSLLNHAT